jgi:hypothetical protein
MYKAIAENDVTAWRESFLRALQGHPPAELPQRNAS